MAARDHTNGDQFGSPAEVPPEYGTTPISSGMVRFNHYTTSPEAARSIQRTGLLRSKGEESFARGGTESPQVFATSGEPTSDFKRSHVFVEGYANPDRRGGQLDIGENYLDMDPEAWSQHLSSHRSTITARGDIPASQILAVHEPWHETYRYIMGDPRTRQDTLHGEYDSLQEDDPLLRKAITAAKTAVISSVMLGGKP